MLTASVALAVLAVLLWPPTAAWRHAPSPTTRQPERAAPAESGASSRRQQRARPSTALAGDLDALAAALAAGVPTSQAVQLVHGESTNPQPWSELAAAAARGQPLGPVWRRLSRSLSLPHLEVVAAAWEISERLGSPLADAVATAASGLRSREESTGRLRVATAGARASAALLSALPVVGVGMALLLGIPPTTLYGGPLQLAALTAALLLILAGRRWTQAQIDAVPRRAARAVP